MKNLLLLTFLFTFTSFVAKAQQVPEKSNTIVLTQADSIGLKEKVLKVLADRDYTISSGKTAPVISTAAKTLKNGARVYYNVQIKGAEIILSGKLPNAGQSSTTIA